MLIALHKQARTTPAVRAEIAASHEPVAVLARLEGQRVHHPQVEESHRLQRPPAHPAHAGHHTYACPGGGGGGASSPAASAAR